jgi:mediator of RNA polymerase II transcription subunit 28
MISNGSYMGYFLIGFFILFCLLLCAAVVDVERHARDFMETAKSLQLFFIKAQHQHKPTREEALRKELATLEAELKAKDALIEAQKKLLQSWQGLLQAQRNVLVKELEQV